MEWKITETNLWCLFQGIMSRTSMHYVYQYFFKPTLLSEFHNQKLLDPLICDNSQGVIHI